MYAIATFPAIKIVESKGILFEEKESCLKFHGKIGGVWLSFNVFGSVRKLIKDYGIKPGDYMTITAELKTYKNQAGKIDESYNVLSAIPVSGAEKAVWPTVYFPSLKVTTLAEGEAKTGNYYKISASEMSTRGGVSPLRNFNAWTGGSYELVKMMKLRTGSEISAVATARYTVASDGSKKIDYTLLSFDYLSNRGRKRKNDESAVSKPTEEKPEVTKVEEPAFEDVIDMPVPQEKKNVELEYNPDEFDSLFT